jgi:hypothetical protein
MTHFLVLTDKGRLTPLTAITHPTTSAGAVRADRMPL